jgi:ribose transport system ATP-binding protein
VNTATVQPEAESGVGDEMVLELVDVMKCYPGVTALKGVSIEVKRHEVVGLIGENGAGKSTLLKILTGVEQPTSGTLSLRGQTTALRGPSDANRQGIAMVFQEQSLIDNITVGENVLLGNEGSAVRAGVYRWSQLRAQAQKYLDIVSTDLDAASHSGELPFAKRQMIEVAKALASSDRPDREPVILLDEPTSVLEAEEIERLFELVRELRTRASVLFVSHRMEEVLEVCDRVYVLRDGAVVGEAIPSEVETHDLFAMMVGDDLSEGYYHEGDQTTPGDGARLELRGLSGAAFHDIDLTVGAGEVVALLGVQESGRQELGRAIFGAVPSTSGEIVLDGCRLRGRSPSECVGKGVGYIPSERKVDGAVLSMSVAENMVLAHPREVTRAGVFDPVKERRTVHEWMAKLRVKAPSSTTPLRTLSGGNQQKVVLAKWLLDPALRLLVLDTPTRGLDVGAKSDFYALVRELAAKGLGVLLIADTLEEGIHMSHRVITMRDGRISGEFSSSPGARPDRAQVLERML